MKIIRPAPTKTSRYNQITQDVPVKFSFVNETPEGDYRLLHTPFICRDYFNECVAGNRFKQKHSIYGFAWDPKQHSLDEDHTKLYVDVSDFLSGKEAESLHELVFAIRDFELELGRSFTKVLPTESPTEFVFIADKKWQESCLGMNIYTMMIKCICKAGSRFNGLGTAISLPTILDEVSKTYTKEGGYLRFLQEKVEGFSATLDVYSALVWLADNADLIEFKEPQGGYEYIAGLHNSSGIQAFATALGFTKEARESSLGVTYGKFYALADKFQEQFTNP